MKEKLNKLCYKISRSILRYYQDNDKLGKYDMLIKNIKIKNSTVLSFVILFWGAILLLNITPKNVFYKMYLYQQNNENYVFYILLYAVYLILFLLYIVLYTNTSKKKYLIFKFMIIGIILILYLKILEFYTSLWAMYNLLLFLPIILITFITLVFSNYRNVIISTVIITPLLFISNEQFGVNKFDKYCSENYPKNYFKKLTLPQIYFHSNNGKLEINAKYIDGIKSIREIASGKLNLLPNSVYLFNCYELKNAVKNTNDIKRFREIILDSSILVLCEMYDSYSVSKCNSCNSNKLYLRPQNVLQNVKYKVRTVIRINDRTIKHNPEIKHNDIVYQSYYPEYLGNQYIGFDGVISNCQNVEYSEKNNLKNIF